MELSPEEMKFVLQGGQINVSRQGDKIVTACSISQQTVSMRSWVPIGELSASVLSLASAIRAVLEKRLSEAKDDLKLRPKRSMADDIIGGGSLGDIFGFK